MNRRSFIRLFTETVAAVVIAPKILTEPLKRSIQLVKSGEVSLPAYPGQAWYISSSLEDELELIPPVHPNCHCSVSWEYPYNGKTYTGFIEGLKPSTYYHMVFDSETEVKAVEQ